MVKIDLGNTYELINACLDREYTHMEFLCPQADESTRIMRVEITPHPDPFLPGVSNLAMGPLTDEGGIDDQIRLKHRDRAAVYATLVFCILGFLNEHPDLMVGLDGSDDLRAAMYHSIFLSNRNYLDDYFVSVGVDWYVKLLRNRKDIERNADGEPFFKPIPESFDHSRSRHELYRYYIVHLNR